MPSIVLVILSSSCQVSCAINLAVNDLAPDMDLNHPTQVPDQAAARSGQGAPQNGQCAMFDCQFVPAGDQSGSKRVPEWPQSRLHKPSAPRYRRAYPLVRAGKLPVRAGEYGAAP